MKVFKPKSNGRGDAVYEGCCLGGLHVGDRPLCEGDNKHPLIIETCRASGHHLPVTMLVKRNATLN